MTIFGMRRSVTLALIFFVAPVGSLIVYEKLRPELNPGFIGAIDLNYGF